MTGRYGNDRRPKKSEKVIKSEAKRHKNKYIEPPKTTDFGIMFLPLKVCMPKWSAEASWRNFRGSTKEYSRAHSPWRLF